MQEEREPKMCELKKAAAQWHVTQLTMRRKFLDSEELCTMVVTEAVFPENQTAFENVTFSKNNYTLHGRNE
jgi:hypothetical protein